MYGALTLWSLVGFLLASYAVIANDSVQTLGTWMASNNERFKWYTMWFAASSVLLCAVWYGWYVYGDISYGRLDRIPFQEVQWYHALAPAILLTLTAIGVPVSTSFLVLSAFASTFVLEKMLMKSVMGYAVAAIAAYAIWFGVSKLMDESKPVAPEHRKFCVWHNGRQLGSFGGLGYHTICKYRSVFTPCAYGRLDGINQRNLHRWVRFHVLPKRWEDTNYCY